MTIKFSGKGLAFLNHYKAKKDIRYYLEGVYIRPLPDEAGGGVLGIATNGHVLAMWHDEAGHADCAAILKIRRELAAACGRRYRLDGDPMLVLRDNRLACVVGENEVYVQPHEGRTNATGVEPWEIAGRFPDVGRVIPDLWAENGPANPINPEYLGLVAKSMQMRGSITMRQAREDGAVLVLCEELPQAGVVLMPNHGNVRVPDWLRRFTSHDKRTKESAAAPLPVYEPSDADPGTAWYPGSAA
ncbi:hypothetical protein [Pseudomonas sp.]|uniref:hypothetical protein n=1 Tax=Pseudomonas sp. TaxID=306 RepID=UPI00258A7759|nr:hypothetical protein [Pseudomonas sp.]